MGQSCRGPFRRIPRRMTRRMSRRMSRRTPRRPVPRTGSRRCAPARQASVTRLRGKFRHAPAPSGKSRPTSRARQVAPDEPRPAGRARRPVPRTGSRRRAPARQASVTRPPLPAGRARQVAPDEPRPTSRARQAAPGDRSRGPGAAAAPLCGKPPSRARPFRRASPGRPCPSVAPGARRAPRPFRDAACLPQVQIKNIETASIRVSCGLRPLETLAFCAAAQDLGRCPKPRQGAKGSVSPVGCCAQRKATRSAPEGSVSPVGCCAQRKATRRCEQIQGLCAAAHRTPIFARAAKP